MSKSPTPLLLLVCSWCICHLLLLLGRSHAQTTTNATTDPSEGMYWNPPHFQTKIHVLQTSEERSCISFFSIETQFQILVIQFFFFFLIYSYEQGIWMRIYHLMVFQPYSWWVFLLIDCRALSICCSSLLFWFVHTDHLSDGLILLDMVEIEHQWSKWNNKVFINWKRGLWGPWRKLINCGHMIFFMLFLNSA